MGGEIFQGKYLTSKVLVVPRGQVVFAKGHSFEWGDLEWIGSNRRIECRGGGIED